MRCTLRCGLGGCWSHPENHSCCVPTFFERQSYSYHLVWIFQNLTVEMYAFNFPKFSQFNKLPYPCERGWCTLEWAQRGGWADIRSISRIVTRPGKLPSRMLLTTYCPVHAVVFPQTTSKLTTHHARRKYQRGY